jgi:WD40 repeat protein
MTISAVSFYVTGGTVQRDAPCYVERQADSTLYDGLMQGSFCYVLTSRQMGKSSLMVRTATRLREEGVVVAVLDLTAIGQNLNPEQWYNGLLSQVGSRLGLEDELDDFIYEKKQLSPLQRWLGAIREVVLPRSSGRVVIFVDEIDTVRSLPFSTDEFFAGIRELYNSRSEDAELERLTFCLLGVAAPSDLIRDTRTTPFNIGERIELNDFTEAEAMPLAKGLMREPKLAKELLTRVLYWTGGHPYLTQRLCRTVAEDLSLSNTAGVDDLCEKLFFSHRAQERDDNLLFVRERMLRGEVDIAGLLDLYKQVYTGKRVLDYEVNPLVTALRLSGIARVENGCLRTRNRIYQRVFDLEWVKINMPDAELQRQRTAYRRGAMRAAAISAVILGIIVSILFFAVKQRNHAKGQELINRQQLYASRIVLAYQAWDKGNADEAAKLLEYHLPESDQEDLRGFEWHYLWRLCHSHPLTLLHKDVVHDVAFSPDGKMLATGSEEDDYTAKLWDVTSGRELAALKGHTGRVTHVAFSPDGKIMATGSNDYSAKLWDVAGGRELTTLSGHRNVVYTVAFSPDGKMLATGSFDKTVKLWDVASGRELATLNGHNNAVYCVAFSPDGKTLASASSDNTAKLWDIASGRVLATLDRHRNFVFSVDFSPDGKTLATGSFDDTAKLWDVASGRELATLNGHTNVVYSVAFSPDGKTLATGSFDRTVKLWDVASRQELTFLKGHTDLVCDVAFSPDGKMLATASYDKTAKLWDLSSVKKWNLLEGHTGSIRSIAFSPDGKNLATASMDQTVRLWDPLIGEELGILAGHKDSVNSVTFSPDGKSLASASDDATVELWDVVRRQGVASLKGHKAMVNGVSFSPNGKTLASASSDRTVGLWDPATGQELAFLNGHTDSVYSVQFSPDGKKLASGSWDGAVKIWDLSTRRESATLEGHSGKIYLLLFSPDGKILASVSRQENSSKILLWDMATGKEMASILEANQKQPFIAFSPDSKRLAITSGNNLKLFDLVVRQELVTFEGPNRSIKAVAFSPDGKTIATGGQGKSVRLWQSIIEKEALAREQRLAKIDIATLPGPLNLTFEQGEPGQLPIGWLTSDQLKEYGFTVKLSEEHPQQGRQCALIERDLESRSILNRKKDRSFFASMTQIFDARPYYGKRVRFRAAVRIEAVEQGANAQLLLSADLFDGRCGFFHNMKDRPITSNEWHYYEIVEDINEETEYLNLGVMLTNGEGRVWIDDASFDVIGKSAKK